MALAEPVAALKRLGQSVWLDQLDRAILESGELSRLRDAGVSGVTANPSIFAKSLEASEVYEAEVAKRLGGGQLAEEILWDMLIEDVRAAADVLRPVFERSGGADGFVSTEVSPELAHDTQATVAAARDLRERCSRANVMVKIPATIEGLPAIRLMLAEGANINVTLIFAVERYVDVVEAFLAGLEDYLAAGGDLKAVNSVASFFVSRVDTKVDAQLEALTNGASEDKKGPLAGLMGKAAIANSKLAYELFGQAHSGRRWERLEGAGAKVQRCLWASTSTKNPKYPDTMYVDELVGPQTINTMPLATFKAFADHGRAEPTLSAGLEDAHRVLNSLATVGIDLAAVTQQLEDEGVEAFAKSYRDSVERIASKKPD